MRPAVMVIVCTLSLSAPAIPVAQTTSNLPSVVSGTDQIDHSSPPTNEGVRIESGGATMVGMIYIANGPGPHPTVVFLHGFPQFDGAVDLARPLRRAGFNFPRGMA